MLNTERPNHISLEKGMRILYDPSMQDERVFDLTTAGVVVGEFPSVKSFEELEERAEVKQIIDEEIRQAQLRNNVETLLARLSEEDRNLLELAFGIKGGYPMTDREISEQMPVFVMEVINEQSPEEAIRQRRLRVLAFLRESTKDQIH